ncbi:hypothetical protein EVAR_29349_1 [Eumeta japonica]|uniref:Uncharacterized protein n=1 Tax=Eumeta variegata TaxID=151549 RepID=A0A4C1WI93_EUMVA|nr:hypothetical protein EVAR_29349_1 [Eumeta japonica]
MSFALTQVKTTNSPYREEYLKSSAPDRRNRHGDDRREGSSSISGSRRLRLPSGAATRFYGRPFPVTAEK